MKKSDKRIRIKSAGARLQEENYDLLKVKGNFFVEEAYKTLRTNVMFSLPGKGSCKVIIVTSALPGEGKSVTSASLAISYAETEKRVLLVNCDLRKPKQARLLGIRAAVGLSNVLVDPDLLEEAIIHEERLKLDVLLAGDIPPNPAELLSSGRMQELLDVLRKRYDFIILDTPPVNLVTDAVALTPYVDGALFVTRAGHSERNSVIHAISQLEIAQAKILGFVLTDADMEYSARYSDKYKHSGAYGYKYDRQSSDYGDQGRDSI